MSKLKIQTGDGAMVPGKQEAEAQKKQRAAKAESDANSVFNTDRGPVDTGPDYTYSRLRLHKKDEVNVYAAEQDARYAMDPRLRKLIIIAVALVVVFVLVCILPTEIFSRAPQKQALSVLLGETVAGFQNFLSVFLNPYTQYATYFFTILVTILAGAAMALSGGIFQGSLKNALASPSTLGVTSGGMIGAILYAFFVMPTSQTLYFQGSYTELNALYETMSPGQVILEQFGGFICAFLGCVIIVVLIMAIALLAGRGKVSNVALVVAGQVFTSLIALIINWIRMWFNNHGDSDAATYLAQATTSSFSGAYTPLTVAIFAVPLLICMVICLAMSRRMSLLAFDEDEARSMGISTGRTRILVVGLCTVMTALVISFCGMVGFVGFLVPHIARKLIGPDFRYLLPACALIGGILMCAVYYITELGIPFLASGSAGIITSIIGCAGFLVVALRSRRSSGGEWL